MTAPSSGRADLDAASREAGAATAGTDAEIIVAEGAGGGDVRTAYLGALAARGYQADDAQRAAIDRLQRLSDDLKAGGGRRGSWLGKLLRRPVEAPRGVYLWGGVGRGKSFLMDAFFQAAPVERRARLHFHEFMRGVHQELGDVRGQADPLVEVARRIAERYALICFDEFHVSDIADAMILHRLLDRLFAHGVAFVMTSNYPPSDLYPDGLHRDRILPAIALIQSRMDVLNVDAGVDYRRRSLEQVPVYITPIDAETPAALQALFERLSDTTQPLAARTITIERRELPVRALSGSVAWFDFATLCGGPRSQNDYLALAERFHAIILSDVPRMGPREASEARRFTWLVDVFYDHRVKLILSAEVEPEALYTEGPMANEFHRTVSRLLEMQSREYLESDRRAVTAWA